MTIRPKLLGAGCSFRFSGQLSIFRPESGRRCARCCNFFQRYDDRRNGEYDPPLHDVDQYSESPSLLRPEQPASMSWAN